MSTVAVVQNKDISKSINEALGFLSITKLIKGKEVAVKPNETWASKEDLTAVTQAEPVRAVIRYIKKFKPKKIVITGGAGAAETEDVFKLVGIEKVAKEERVEIFDHNRAPFKEVKLDYGPQDSVTVNPRVLEYDTLISLANLKVHQTATVTLSMKNIAMSYPAADYYGHPRWIQHKSHRFFADMHGFIVGMCQKFPIDLAIIVGDPAMVGIGPIGGKTFDTGLTIASTDFVAADAVGAYLLGFELQGVRHIKEATELGLGQGDVEKLTIKGMPLEDAAKRFRELAYK